MTTLLLVNPAAGHGRGARLAGETAAALEATWGAVERVDTRGPGEAAGLVSAAVGRGVARVVVLGGDGTLHEAANGLLHTGLADPPPITVLPAGTGNDYARMIGTRGLSPTNAVRRLATGVLRRFDVGQAWGEYFINSIGVGFDAAVARRVNQTRWGTGLPAYLAAVAHMIGKFAPYPATVALDGEQFQDTFLLIEVAIGYSVGGGFRLTPDARLDDGLFDLCAIRKLSIPAILAKLPLAMVGRHTRLRQVRMRRSTQVTITPHDGALLTQFDGEVRQRPGPLDIRLLPGALPVLTVAP